MRTARPRRKKASTLNLWLVAGKFGSGQRGLMLLLPQNFYSVAGDMLGFVTLANRDCVYSVQRCSKITQFS